jgi:hypothetical protein
MSLSAETIDKPLGGYERKPTVVILCTLAYLLNPIGNFIYQWRVSDMGVADYFMSLYTLAFERQDAMVIVNLGLWILAPIVALGIYRVRMWGWFLYLVHASATTAMSLFGPGFSSFGLSSATFINLPFFAVAGYYLFSEVSAPYFNPRLRWWERYPRYRDAIHVIVEGKEYKLFDISSKGLFIVDIDAPKRKVGDKLVAHVGIGDEIASLRMEVIRVHVGGGSYPAGFGARFLSMDSQARRAVSEYIRVLKRSQKEALPKKASAKANGSAS